MKHVDDLAIVLVNLQGYYTCNSIYCRPEYFRFTQERALGYLSFPRLDLFIIDEFYKLDPKRDPDRAFLLNQAFYRLYRTGAQFYMLGPNIRQLPLELPSRLRFRFVATDYATVVSETIRVRPSAATRLALAGEAQ